MDKNTEEAREAYNEYLAKVKDEFNEPRFTWPLLKLIKIYTTQSKEDGNQVSLEEVTDCITLGNLLKQLEIIFTLTRSKSHFSVRPSSVRPSSVCV